MARIAVYHSYYGCDTGCCGHVIEMEDETGEYSAFHFDHPGWKQDHLEWAQELVRSEFGEAHVADLDWENSHVYDD